MVSDFIEEVSRKVWRTLAQVKRSTGISINEETLTENLLYDFLGHNSANIRILQTRKDIEGVQGTDWEWFVGSNKFGWVRFAIQAKRIDLETKRYESLRYFSGESSKKQLQSDILSGKIGDTDHLNSLQTDQSFSTTLLPADWVVLGD